MSINAYFIFIIILMLMNIPVAFVLLIPSVFYFILSPNLTLISACGRLVNTPNSFPLLAVPFFILLGNIMNTGGITERIFRFAKNLVGHFPGGLGHANVLASIIFSGMSGTALADIGGLGEIELKAMRDAGYDDEFSCAITAASSIIGPIFPPSVPLVIYGVIAEISIGKLLAGGVLPGLLIGVFLMIIVYYISVKKKYPVENRATIKEIIKSFLDSFPALFTVVIILGSMFSGIATPTEAAILGVAYAIFLGFVIYKEMNLKDLFNNLRISVYRVSSVMLIVAGAFLFSRIITLENVPQTLTHFFIKIAGNSPFYFLIALNIVLLIIGCLLEGVAALIIIVPIVLPISKSLGIDSVHLGVVMVLNLMIGLLTPPMGLGLYLLSQIASVPFKRLIKAIMPFYIPLLFALLLITFFPQLVLYVPKIMFGL